MILDLADGRADRVGVSVSVVIWCAFGVLVVNADGVLVISVRLLDDPAMSGASGLDFIEVIRLPDEFEVGRS